MWLIGMMGSGKTTVGALLADRTGRPFHDVDRTVQARMGSTIAALWEREGEDAFRALEAAVIAVASGASQEPRGQPVVAKLYAPMPPTARAPTATRGLRIERVPNSMKSLLRYGRWDEQIHLRPFRPERPQSVPRIGSDHSTPF